MQQVLQKGAEPDTAAGKKVNIDATVNSYEAGRFWFMECSFHEQRQKHFVLMNCQMKNMY